jgi:hypothetical protein
MSVRLRVAWFTAVAAVLLLLAFDFFLAFTAPLFMHNPGSGSPWAPHSDALGPWLDGALAYLFGLPAPTYVYRPTVAVFWASILAITGRVPAISMLFCGWLLLILASASVFADRGLRAAVLMTTGIFAMRFWETWATVNLNVDLAALAITCSGAVLIVWTGARHATAALLVGSLCLGLAAALRGPMIFGGILMLALRFWRGDRPPFRVMAVAAGVFLLPLVIDISLQRHIGAINNGMMALYCVYSDPTHGWTGACNIEFLKHRPGGAQILREFTAYVFSPDGMARFFQKMVWRLSRDFSHIHAASSVALMAAVALLHARERPAGSVLRLVLVAIALLLVGQADMRINGSALAAFTLAIVAAALGRQWRALMVLSGYLGGTVFLCLASLFEDRLQHTFAFMLPLGIALLAVDTSQDDAAPWPAGRTSVAVAIASLILVLYTAAFVPGGEVRQRYIEEVLNKQAALKISDDARIDRSLYYSGNRDVFYTRYDNVPIGTVRRYRGLASNASGNVSFLNPNSFLD